MKLASVIRVFSALCFSITATLAAVSLSKPNCQEKCGNVTIPYPFGISDKCSANSSFTVICQNSTIPPRPVLSSINMEVVNISLYGIVIVNLPVSPMNCSDGPGATSASISLKGGSFSISSHYNSLVVMGCTNSVWLRTNATTAGGCMPECDANSTDTSCNGVNCCQASIPTRLQELQYTYQSSRASSNSSFCGYVFPADKKWLQDKGYKRYKGLVSDMLNPFDREFRFAPLVLEWEFDITTTISDSDCVDHEYFCSVVPDDYRCQLMSGNYENEDMNSFYYGEFGYASSRRYCRCPTGFEGNPYISEGCSDIDECSDARLNNCPPDTTCFNQAGDYYCETIWKPYSYMSKSKRSRVIISSIVIGSVVGGLILLVAAWKFGKDYRETIKAIKASRKYMFFKRNGGIFLEQQLAAIENGIQKTRLFSSIELAKATDDYNENRILGRGGEGVVYKGMLEDGIIVAVKKLGRVNQGDVEAFINEVVIVSQINHRNVVKLLGCCLESEVPHLVYEYIPNGTLFSHIHHPHEDFPLFWETRVRIAKQVAGALAYLHSAASVPIYHRDIKSTNILLDEKYRARISDFGTSRSISIDQTHVTTRVVGTFGYLDPEYFQSNQFTEKSDVYSFGVVLVELLTGEKAISVVRIEEGRGLAMHFLHSMEENQLFDILDARVLKEGKREEIEAMAHVARKCLHLNGKSRPTMMEVARHLGGIQVEEEQESDFSRIQIENSGCSDCNSIDDVESTSFASISESSSEPPSADEPVLEIIAM